MPKDPLLVSTGEVARALGVTVNTVKNWIGKGFIQGIRLPSGHYRIPRGELERLGAGPPLAASGRERERAWRTYEEWRRRQPLSMIDSGELLQWNDRMLKISKAYGPFPMITPEEKAQRVRAMHKAMATLT